MKPSSVAGVSGVWEVSGNCSRKASNGECTLSGGNWEPLKVINRECHRQIFFVRKGFWLLSEMWPGGGRRPGRCCHNVSER